MLVKNMRARARGQPRTVLSVLPETRVLRKVPLTAQAIASALRGKCDERCSYEGWIIEDPPAWIDERCKGEIYVRCHDWRLLIERAAAVLTAQYFAPALRTKITYPVPTGKRSDVIFKICATLFERGAITPEVEQVIWGSKVGRSKFGNRESVRREVLRIFHKVGGYGR